MSRSNPYTIVVNRFRKRVKLLKVDRPLEIVDPSTGEMRAVTPLVGNRELRDTREFIKLYEWRYLLSMDKNELKVFIYLIGKMSYGGAVRFDYKECAKECGVSVRLVYKGLEGLIERDVIKRDSRCNYWVNPNIAFKGVVGDNMNIEFAYEEGSSAE